MKIRWLLVRDRVRVWACWIVQDGKLFLLGHVREQSPTEWVARIRSDQAIPEIKEFTTRQDAAKWFAVALGFAHEPGQAEAA